MAVCFSICFHCVVEIPHKNDLSVLSVVVVRADLVLESQSLSLPSQVIVLLCHVRGSQHGATPPTCFLHYPRDLYTLLT